VLVGDDAQARFERLLAGGEPPDGLAEPPDGPSVAARLSIRRLCQARSARVDLSRQRFCRAGAPSPRTGTETSVNMNPSRRPMA
jgi:hypothetical protein